MADAKTITSNLILVKILWVVAIHSFVIGICLLVTPSNVFEYLGYNLCTERFFPTQGGVFHIVMAIGYAIGAIRITKSTDLVVFSIIVKLCATLFLIIYFVFVKQIWVILLSAIADCLMGIVIWWAYSNYINRAKI